MSTDSPTTADAAFAQWLVTFERLAREHELDWLLPPDVAARRKAFEQGLSAEDEIATIKDMCEWRGCGCGA